MGLFLPSLDQLRENFVRARFAEEPVFGESNIDVLLEKMRLLHDWTADKNGLKKIIDPDAALGREIEVLCKYVRPVEKPCFGDSEVAKTLAESLGFTGVLVQFFQVDEHSVIMVCHNSGQEKNTSRAVYFSQTEKGELRVCSLSSKQVMQAILRYSENGYKPARDFILSSAEDKIRAERAKAEADFNSAVAVTPFGDKIFKAEAVVVFGDKRSDDLIFDPACFADQKILYCFDSFGDHTLRRGIIEFFRSVEGFLRDYDNWFGNEGAFRKEFYHLAAMKKERSISYILCVPRKYCPDPLPAGGRPIKKV